MQCKVCGKEAEKFVLYKSGNIRFCIDCNHKDQKRYRDKCLKEGKHEVINHIRVENNKTRKREYIRNYLLLHPCIDCGEKDIIVLEFDHYRDKKANVSSMISDRVSLQDLINEIDKCCVRCANCHRRKTAIEQNNYRIMPPKDIIVVEKMDRVFNNAKITLDIANEIRERYSIEDISHSDLAKEYGICKSAIGDIIKGRTWKDK